MQENTRLINIFLLKLFLKVLVFTALFFGMLAADHLGYDTAQGVLAGLAVVALLALAGLVVYAGITNRKDHSDGELAERPESDSSLTINTSEATQAAIAESGSPESDASHTDAKETDASASEHIAINREALKHIGLFYEDHKLLKEGRHEELASRLRKRTQNTFRFDLLVTGFIGVLGMGYLLAGLLAGVIWVLIGRGVFFLAVAAMLAYIGQLERNNHKEATEKLLIKKTK